MNKKILTATLLSCFSLTALADSPTFNYFDIGYVTWRADGSSLSNSPSGLELNFSSAINDNFYIAGDLNYISNNGRSTTLATAGAGYMNHFSDTTSFFAELDVAIAKAENRDSQIGYEIDFGIRSMISEKLELKGAIEYIDINNADTFLNIGTAYYFSDSFGAYFDYKINEDIHRFSIGIRSTF